MSIHLIKLCVGADSIEDLGRWQARRLKETGSIGHVTRMFPKRAAELLDGGSLYWVIKGLIQVRQRVVAIDRVEGEDGVTRCRLVFTPELVPVRPAPRRPFQGWRYLKPADAPPDWGMREGDEDPPPGMREELAELGLI